MYVVDTDVSIEYLRGNPEVTVFLESAEQLYLTTVTVGELYYGAYNAAKPAAALRGLADFVQRFDLLTMQLWDAVAFGEIKHSLKKKGTIVGDADIMNAAMTRTHGFTMVTRNLRHYRNVTGLHLRSI